MARAGAKDEEEARAGAKAAAGARAGARAAAEAGAADAIKMPGDQDKGYRAGPYMEI